MTSRRQPLHSRIRETLIALGADGDLVRQRHLPIHPDARHLCCVGIGSDGRDKFLTPATAAAWQAMQGAAREQGVVLLLISAFRSFDYQLALIRGKRAKGRDIGEILAINAPPGCSEHHSGRAVDIGYAGMPPLEEDFETTPAFVWLLRFGADFGFQLSYPRDNRHGYLYEPWHWCFQARRRPRLLNPAADGSRGDSSSVHSSGIPEKP